MGIVSQIIANNQRDKENAFAREIQAYELQKLRDEDALAGMIMQSMGAKQNYPQTPTTQPAAPSYLLSPPQQRQNAFLQTRTQTGEQFGSPGSLSDTYVYGNASLPSQPWERKPTGDTTTNALTEAIPRRDMDVSPQQNAFVQNTPLAGMPTPEQIWEAARGGKVRPQVALQYQQQYSAQVQAMEDKAYADFEAYHKPMMTNAYETGNDELFQASLQAGVSSGIPRVARVAQSMLDANIHISGKGETKAQSVMSPETRSRLLKDAGNDPTTQDAIKAIPDGQSFEVAHKGKRISEIKPIDKNVTEEQLTARALRGDKEAQRILDAMEKRKLKIARENRAIIKQYSSGGHGEHGGGGGAPDFAKWTKENKKWWFDRSLTNPADKPDFGYGKAAAASRSQYSRELAAYARGKGITGPEAAERKAEFAADQSALRDLTKRKELIGTFTNRIDATSKVVLDIAKKYQKTNSRLLNMPLNRLAGFMGSGEYQSLKLALKSLSNEVAKVESGSLGIAEVSVEQAKYMEKVHDADLSINDMKKVVETGQTLGKTSMQSIEQQRRDLTQRMKGYNAASSGHKDDSPKARNTSKAVSYLKGAKNRQEAIERIKKLAVANSSEGKWTREELSAIAQEAGWE